MVIISYFKKQGKNTKAKFSPETKRLIMQRDGHRCIKCGSANLDHPHHALYGMEAERGDDRNLPSKGVTLCVDCHYSIHHKGDNALREFCKKYLEKIEQGIKITFSNFLS